MSTIKNIVTDTKSEKSQKAKAELMQFVKIINKKLEDYFNDQLKDPFGVSQSEKKLTKHILQHIKEHNLRPAKRLRGSFVYFGYNLLGGKKEKDILNASMSIELIHTALLMHDDFMDQDETRRGLPTTHEYYKKIHKQRNYRFNSKHYGESMAVNVGDAALLLGYEILGKSHFSPTQKIQALNRTLRGIVNTAYGQAYDITLEGKGVATNKDILDLHLAKTAIYTYENPLHIGAILAGAKESDLELIIEYAIPGGIAFQLQDDILGLFGDPKKTGKPAHSDLRQGKMTLLIIKALDKANKKQRSELMSLWGKRKIRDKDADVARKIVIDTGSLDHSKKISRKWAKKAQEAIPQMKNKGWNKEAINYLDGIAQYMVEREI